MQGQICKKEMKLREKKDKKQNNIQKTQQYKKEERKEKETKSDMSEWVCRMVLKGNGKPG